MAVYCSRVKGDKMAIWEKPATGDRMAPFDDPIANFGLIRFCSDFQYFNNAERVDGIAVSHTAVAGVTGTGYAAPGPLGGSTGPIANGQIVTTNKLLYTHSLGYVPQFMVLYDGAILDGHTCVQITADRKRARFVSAYATTTEIRLREVGISSADALPAATVDYDVVIIRDPEVIPGAPLFRARPAGVVMGYGRITSEEPPLRRAVGAEPFFYIPLGRTGDIRNGAYRSISPYGTRDIGSYNGNFILAEFIKVTF